MNIWIFNHYAIGPGSSGGTRHYDLSKQLIARGHKVTIFASSFNHFTREETIFSNKDGNYVLESINGVDFMWIRTPGYSNSLQRVTNILSYTIKSYSKAIKYAKIDKPDLIIGSSVHPLAALVGYYVSRNEKCLFYFEERDLWPQTFVDFGKISEKNPFAKLLYLLEKFFYKKANRIIVLFDKAKQYVVSKGIDKSKIIYLPNGVDLSNYEQKKELEEIDLMFDGLENKFVVIYLGSHGLANHLDPVIDLFENLNGCSDIHLLMVGNGNEKDRLKQIVKKKQLSNITFKDAITKNKVPSLLAKADLSIISMLDSPLYKWGFSMNKIYDYMAAGLPILMIATPSIAGDFGEIRGVTVSRNLNEIKSKIEHYMTHDIKKQEDSESLKEYVNDHYSWEKLALVLDEFIKKDAEQFNFI
ncbi:glycosyltransferase family 4 protein [Domibacillus epiphyticus]|uniref:Glycosyltransferase WbuB n=1 Tax=Domibacillus epiphyticus TaxID=1714355 RepID=A0A1V2A6K5_9BACI|nr:glycosyltransferase family 4 protein [Domibacillus epiphyticus]OMP66635.1 glycosyltransferase WbuB [Domibacillus epiphyticus]